MPKSYEYNKIIVDNLYYGEANEVDLFESKSIVSEDTFRELRRYLKPPHEIIRVAIGSAVCFVTAIAAYIVIRSIAFSALGFFAGIVIPLIYIQQWNHLAKTYWARIQESTGVSKFEQISSFTDEEIKIRNVDTGGMVSLKYDVIARLAETENIYALFTKMNQIIIVNKISIAQEHNTEAFICFIKEKCKNVRWRN
ncbi:MAG: hypothetical protein LBU89_06755 [Fibromonadaceae bacterium]|nr:hypothetical protein [Fibromonadaceae bacterium]